MYSNRMLIRPTVIVNVMSRPIEDGQIFESGGVEYLYDDGEIIEIAESYPSVDAALKALRARG